MASQYLIDALKSIGQPQAQQPPGGGLGQQMLADRMAQNFAQRRMQAPGNGVQQIGTPPIAGDGMPAFDPLQIAPQQQQRRHQITGGLPGLAQMFAGR